ncbi:MAG: HNH endonuclease [Lentimicrobiaceae bacterium]|jgi:putative restriction endonuclease
MLDNQIRLAAFEHLKDLVSIYGDVLPYKELIKGFLFKGERITLLGASGIWKPKQLDLPISITTSSSGPYSDSLTNDGFLKYKYRGTDPNHRDNKGLRELINLQKPLIYFHSVLEGKYMATWPVYIMNDNINALEFTVAVDDAYHISDAIGKAEDPEEHYRRKYLTSSVLVRLHQKSFRERVLAAYQNHCTLCNLRHVELLDAAHIIGDNEDTGEPIIQNGLALCKIHHAAFDQNILGISPDYTIKIRHDILQETDGPMLKYGIQLLDNNSLILPKDIRNYPDKDRLSTRFEQFLKAG